MVALEPQGCSAMGNTDQQIEQIASRPSLILFVDHLDAPQQIGPSWMLAYQDCQKFAARIKIAHGRADLVRLPERGIFGNSHMMMQDRNNAQIANLIIKWLEKLDNL